MGWSMAQVAECLLSKYRALVQTPGERERLRERERERERERSY
jgi:hypothetical protein